MLCARKFLPKFNTGDIIISDGGAVAKITGVDTALQRYGVRYRTQGFNEIWSHIDLHCRLCTEADLVKARLNDTVTIEEYSRFEKLVV